jgi:hypothetical protein
VIRSGDYHHDHHHHDHARVVRTVGDSLVHRVGETLNNSSSQIRYAGDSHHGHATRIVRESAPHTTYVTGDHLNAIKHSYVDTHGHRVTYN